MTTLRLKVAVEVDIGDLFEVVVKNQINIGLAIEEAIINLYGEPNVVITVEYMEAK